MTTIDLHSHSTASDGTLTPTALVEAAHTHGITTLALTDHDTTAGLAEARAAATRVGLELIPGIELSAAHGNKPLHIVGLQIDPEAPPLVATVEHLRGLRRKRAAAIGARLAKLGLHGAYERACELAGDGEVTRTHFARALVEAGHAETMNEVFKRWLGNGKPGYVGTEWPSMDEAVAAIRAAGGIAVLAHPLAYGWTGAWLRRIIEAFKLAGGAGIEVISGNSTPTEIATAAGHARRFSLLASQGSDFHSPDTPWLKLGRLPTMPDDLRPVWRAW